MSGTEWFLLVVVVIGIPLLIAVVVTLWTLEMARQRNKQNRPKPAQPVKRNALKRTPVESPADVSRETDTIAPFHTDRGPKRPQMEE